MNVLIMIHRIKPTYVLVGEVILIGVLLGCVAVKDSTEVGEDTHSISLTGEGLEDNIAVIEPIKIVTTTNILRDWVENVGGNKVEVYSIVPGNVDPHAFRPTPKEIRYLEESDMVFLVGQHYEENWLESLPPNVVKEASKIIYLSESVKLRPYSRKERISEGLDITSIIHYGEDKYGDHEGYDPHFWHDPLRVKDAIYKIALELTGVALSESSYFESNAERYVGRLEELDAWIVSQIEQIPSENRTIITNHQTMGYFAERYEFQLEESIISGFSSTQSASPRQVGGIIDTIKERGVGTVFGEPQMSDKIANAISGDTGVRFAYLDSESMGNAGEGVATSYIEMMKSNVKTVVTGLAK